MWDEGTGSGTAPRHTGKHEDKEAQHGSSGFRAMPWRFGVGRGAHTSWESLREAVIRESRNKGHGGEESWAVLLL